MDTIYLDNSHVVEVDGLRSVDGSLVAGAAVVATLYENDGTTEVPGATWPLTLIYQGSGGRYRGELDAALTLVERGRYKLKISAVIAGKTFAVERTVKAERRYS